MKTSKEIKKEFWADMRNLKKIVKYNSAEFERRWWLIKNSYAHIYICRIYAGSIGEFISRYLMIKEDTDDQISDLYVFIPYITPRKEIANRNLLQLMSCDICVVNELNYDFWKYVFHRHFEELNFDHYKKYLSRRDAYYRVEKGKPLFHLSNLQKKMGYAVAKRIGISSEYVCFHSRDELYNVLTIGKDYGAFIARNNRFEYYEKSIRYLQRRHIAGVRMGKYVSPVSDMKIIDYAGKYYSDFMDMCLIANCKFYVGAASGPSLAAMAFARPVLCVNSVYATVGSGSIINMHENMLIPKKYFNEKTKQYLSLKTIANYENRFGDDTSQYIKRGIKIIENTPEEIYDAVVEMNARLDGTWEESAEDVMLQKRYMEILSGLNEKNRKKFWNGGGLLYRIGSKYLRENKYLLD